MLVIAVASSVILGFALVPSNLNHDGLIPNSVGGNSYHVKSSGALTTLSFEQNQGQFKDNINFAAYGPGGDVYLTSDEVILSLAPVLQKKDRSSSLAAHVRPIHPSRMPNVKRARESKVIRMSLVGTRAAEISGIDVLPGTVNYFIGKETRNWHTNIRTYRAVKYRNVYPGIDQIFYGNGQELEYDYIISPGANPAAIAFNFRGQSTLKIDHTGDLVLHLASDQHVRIRRPVAYQNINGRRQEISIRYRVRRNRDIGFEIGAYDRAKTLVIDPVLSYSSYLGGSGNDTGFDVAVDNSGNTYVSGVTDSSEFSDRSGTNAFVARFNVDGSQRTYLAIIGGAGDDSAFSVGIDGFGAAYITGATDSSDFPLVNSFQSAFGGGAQDAFFSKLNPSGTSLIYSTYFGGSGADAGFAIAVDSTGSAYATGSTDSPEVSTLGNSDAFVTKISASGSSREYFTVLGGAGDDKAFDLALDGAGNAYIVGSTDSSNFSIVNALQPNNAGLGDGFLTKLGLSGGIIYSTYFGGSGTDSCFGIAVGGNGEAYIAGSTDSPEFAGLGGRDAFAAKFDSTGSGRIYLTVLGGNGDDAGFAIAVDIAGNAYVTGSTNSNNFTVANPIQPNLRGSQDVFLSKLNSTGSSLEFSTYIGGDGNQSGFAVTLDPLSNVFVTGFTNSRNFPISNPFQSITGGNGDAFLLRISGIATSPTPTPTPTVSPTPTPSPGEIQLILDDSGPATDQAAALDSILFIRDPFPVVNGANVLNRSADSNTRLLIFAINVQLQAGEPSSAVVVNLVDAKNQSIDVVAEDVRAVPNTNLTQVMFRLPNNLAIGTCTIKIKAQNHVSNSGTIRIRL